MVGMRTRLAIERAGTVTPHLKRGAPVLYPNPNGNGEQQIGRTYGATAPVLDPTKRPANPGHSPTARVLEPRLGVHDALETEKPSFLTTTSNNASRSLNLLTSERTATTPHAV
jgi:hypothetical protein